MEEETETWTGVHRTKKREHGVDLSEEKRDTREGEPRDPREEEGVYSCGAGSKAHHNKRGTCRREQKRKMRRDRNMQEGALEK